MELTAAGCVILNAMKDLCGTLDKILHCVQDDNTYGVGFEVMTSLLH